MKLNKWIKRNLIRILLTLLALALLIPIKVVRQRDLDAALLRELGGNCSLRGELPGNLSVVEALLRKGARPNDQAQLFIGILRGNAIEVETALRHGADANAEIYTTPLIYAMGREHPDVIRVLLAHGANVNKGTFYATPLINAALHQDVQAIRLLLAAGANVNLTDDNGVAPLDRAWWTTAEDNGYIISRLLLKAGAKSRSARLKEQGILLDTAAPEVNPSQAKKSRRNHQGR